MLMLAMYVQPAGPSGASPAPVTLTPVTAAIAPARAAPRSGQGGQLALIEGECPWLAHSRKSNGNRIRTLRNAACARYSSVRAMPPPPPHLEKQTSAGRSARGHIRLGGVS